MICDLLTSNQWINFCLQNRRTTNSRMCQLYRLVCLFSVYIRKSKATQLKSLTLNVLGGSLLNAKYMIGINRLYLFNQLLGNNVLMRSVYLTICGFNSFTFASGRQCLE